MVGLFRGMVLCSVIATLFGCGKETEPEPLPPLVVSELKACWYIVESKSGCVEMCFGGGGTYYTRSNNASSKGGEGLGKFKVTGNLVQIRFQSRSLVNSYIDSVFIQWNFFIQSDSLKDSNGDNMYMRSDSTHNCGPHWLIFSKPADWDSV